MTLRPTAKGEPHARHPAGGPPGWDASFSTVDEPVRPPEIRRAWSFRDRPPGNDWRFTFKRPRDDPDNWSQVEDQWTFHAVAAAPRAVKSLSRTPVYFRHETTKEIYQAVPEGLCGPWVGGRRAAGALPARRAAGGRPRARSHCRFAPPPLVRFMPDSLMYLVAPVLKRQCDRTLGRPGPHRPHRDLLGRLH
jgi:hypothetical protein